MPGLYYHDAWLWLYDFSKLRKLGVNLAVSNDRVFQMPVNYVIGSLFFVHISFLTQVFIPQPSRLQRWARFGGNILRIFFISEELVFQLQPITPLYLKACLDQALFVEFVIIIIIITKSYYNFSLTILSLFSLCEKKFCFEWCGGRAWAHLAIFSKWYDHPPKSYINIIINGR